MPSYTFSKNSFVYPDIIAQPNCAIEIKTCLPVFERTDVAFQFIDNTPNAESYKAIILSNGAYIGAQETLKMVDIGDGNYLLYLDKLPDTSILNDGQCFQIAVGVYVKGNPAPILLFHTNCFIKIDSKCWTSRITYWCNEDSFDFIYTEEYFYFGDKIMKNKIRLPFYIKGPQFPVKRNVFVKSNGERKKLSSRISNEYNGYTDYMPKEFHEKLVVAMEHDYLFVENVNAGYSDQGFSQEGNYDIDWQIFMDYPTAPAKFKLNKTPYYKTNCS